MRRTPVVVSGLVVVLVGAGLFVFAGRERDVGTTPDEPLEPIATTPRPPVALESPTSPLAPMPTSLKRERPATGRADLVRERNDLAREHRRLVAAYEAGMISMGEVESAEMLLLSARHRLGEIDAPAWHAAREVLFERAAERAQARFDAGVVPFDDVARARLALDLERSLAGHGADYSTNRVAFFAATRKRQQARIDAGVESQKDAAAELERLEDEFPEAEVAKARDR